MNICVMGKITLLSLALPLILACRNDSGNNLFVAATPPSLVAIEVTPADSSLPLCASSRFSATGIYSDGGRQDLTEAAAWSSSDEAVASLKSAGVVYSRSSGTAAISASSKNVAGSATVTVTQPTSIADTPAQNSPFGIFGPYISLTAENSLTSVSKPDVNACLQDLGVTWAEEQPVAADGSTDNIEMLLLAGVKAYSRVGALGTATPPYTALQGYRDKVRSTIRAHKDRVKFWEFGTEPNGSPPPMGWQGYGQGYGVDLMAVHKIMKEECPDCSLVFGGLTGIGTGARETDPPMVFLNDVLSSGAGTAFEVFEFKQHAAHADDYRELKNKYDIYRNIFQQNGLDMDARPVFLETATHDGRPQFPPYLRSQTQRKQAEGLFKYYIYGIAAGVDKIFWNLIYERHDFGPQPGGSFDYYGLINNPDNDGDSSKKLAYYTFKKMVEVLDGSDWNSAETVQDSGGVVICKFMKNARTVYVAWWDYSGDPFYTPGKTISISLAVPGSGVLVTPAVPRFDAGAAVVDYGNAFATETIAPQSGAVTVALGESPLLIEVLP